MRPRPPRQPSPHARVREDERSSVKAKPLNGSHNGKVEPSQVRPRLAELAAANLSDLERVLVETATGANKAVWVSIDCKHCARPGRYEILVPDNRIRLDAVEKLLQQGLGRAGEAQEAPAAQLPRSASEVERLSWRDLQQFAATFCLDELAAVQRRGGEALLRERVAALSAGERAVLRAALVDGA